MSAADKLKEYTRKIQRNPNDFWAYMWRAAAYYELDQFDRAMVDLTKAIGIDPYSAEAYRVRGECYKELGIYSRAQADFARAKELGYDG